MPTMIAFALLAMPGAATPLRIADQTHGQNQPKIPRKLSFVANKGQWSPAAKFLARSPGLDVWVSNDGVTYDFHQATAAPDLGIHPPVVKNGERMSQFQERKGHVVKVQFQGSLNSAHATGIAKRAGISNYIHGDRTVTDVPEYASAQVNGLYQGVDMIVYSDHASGAPRYDLKVSPNADLSAIKMNYTGAKNLRVTKDGKVSYDTSLGTVVENGLAAFQIDESGNKVPVSIAPKIVNGALSYSVPQRDASKTLLIDPVIYSTFVGGSGYDDPKGLAVTPNGFAYVTGTTDSTDFPITTGAYDDQKDGYELYLTKFKQDGSVVIFSTYIGGSSTEYGADVAVDSDGNAIVVGGSYSNDYPIKNAYRSTPVGSLDGVISKFNANGNLVWSTFYGGSNYDYPNAITVDSSNRVYITGYTYSTDFPTLNPVQANLAGSYDGFVARLSPDGQTLGYSTYLGGTGSQQPYDITVDSAGRATIVGDTSSTDYPTSHPIISTSAGQDAFVSQLSTNGSALVFSTYFGGSSSDYARGVATDADGSIYVCGYTYSSDFPHDYNFGGSVYGGYVTKLRSDGRQITFSSVLYYTWADSVAVDSSKRVYLSGYGYGYLPSSPGAIQFLTAGSYDAYVTRMAPNGSALTYFTNFGGNATDEANKIALDSSNNVYLYGHTNSHDFPIKNGAYDTDFVGGTNNHGFLASLKLDEEAVSIDPVSSVVGGSDVNITIRLSSAAGAGGQTVTLGGGGGTIVLPASATVPAGQTTTTVTAHTKGVNTERIFLVTAKVGTTVASRKVMVNAATPDKIVFSPASVVGGSGTSVTGKVVLNGKAGSNGVLVYLSPRFLPSSLNKATIPPNVTVPANATSVTFTVTHEVTHSLVTMTVTATANGGTGSGVLKIKP